MKSFLAPVFVLLSCAILFSPAGSGPLRGADDPKGEEDQTQATIHCAQLVYANGKTSRCFSPRFLEDFENKTGRKTVHALEPVRLDSKQLLDHPFVVMTGEGAFELSDDERDALRNFLKAGGFVVATAGCSEEEWGKSFLAELAKILPSQTPRALELDHPLFHTVYDIDALRPRRLSAKPVLEGVEVDGRLVLVYCAMGLNDAPTAGDCCCCGGNEILNAMRVNVNLLAYALTH
ncbi:MAG: DUF4159 domain-containing protein [Phycisphaera sp.]|nr:DUF4159 domain-containing protein [Phycisphaera sp.]